MKTNSRLASALLLIDYQTRLMPAIPDRPVIIANTKRLLHVASLLNVPITATEQNARKLGPTVDDLLPQGTFVFPKMTFDACRSESFLSRFSPGGREIVVAGCEAHVCVLQTVLGLLDAGHRVFMVADAVGSRLQANKDAALNRAAHHGVDIVTTEMVVFEWLETAEHKSFKDVLSCIR